MSLFMLPAYIRYFQNQEVLGLWFTALSVLSWLITFDLGIGNGLRNYLVNAFVKNDTHNARVYISSAYLMVGCIVIILSLAGFFLFTHVNWNIFFGVSDTVVSKGVLLNVSRIILLGIMLQFILRLVNSILLALQKPAIPGFLALISNAVILIFILCSNTGTIEKNLINLSYLNVIAVNVPLLVASIIIFLTKLKHSIPSINYFNGKYAFEIVSLGWIFFWLQVMFMTISSTSEFLISRFSKTADVVVFKIYNSLFGMITTFFYLALGTVWSEVTEAYAKR